MATDAQTYLEANTGPVTNGTIDFGALDTSPTYGSSGSAGSPTEQFMRTYQAVLIELYGSATPTARQKALMNLCAKKQWPASVFLTLLRRRDPAYAKTDDYINRTKDAWQLWHQYFPGRALPNKLARAYARSGKNVNWLDWRIRRTTAFKRQYPYLAIAEKRGTAAAAPDVYRNWRNLTNQAYRMYMGRDATRLEQQMLYASGMSGDEFQTRLPQILGGVEAFRWASGAKPVQKTLNAALFMRKGGGAVLNKMAQAQAVRGSFMGSKNTPFGLSIDEETDAILKPRI